MHPIFAKPARLGLYLLAWTPIAGLLVFLMGATPHLGWVEAIELAVPLCIFYAFLCLSAWYMCRARPLRVTGLARALSAHLASALAGAALWVLLARFIASLISLPIERLLPEIPLLFATGVLLYLLSVAAHYVLLALGTAREAQRREAEARLFASEAELRALKAQINPHFLYNSLNSISALTSIDPARAREMCILLSEFLRSTLGLGDRQSIPLRDELELIRRYLAIEKIRFGARLSVEETIADDCLDERVPPLLLQPLVENAVVHGIASVVENGFVRLRATRRAEGGLAITVENSFDAEAPAPRRNGVGLANVRKRLNARYGGGASLRTAPVDDRYRVELTLPVDQEPSA